MSSKYIGPKHKLNKRFSQGIIGKYPINFNKGGFSLKKSSKYSRKKNSLYFTSLYEKQKLKFSYIITEKQSIITFKKAKALGNDSGLTFLKLLELRLDSILFRSDVFITKLQVRQLINHKFVSVNNVVITSPSFECSIGDEVSVKGKYFSKISEGFNCPWINPLGNGSIKVIRFPNNKELEFLDFNIQLIVEFYNRFI